MANSLAFCLEYSNHKSEMFDAFDEMLKNERMYDVMLSCGGNTIKAHKMVLSAGSKYFRSIFSALNNPYQFPIVIIKDMAFADLKAIVEFLYRGEVVVPVEQVSSLSKSAQTLLIKGLEKYFNKSAIVDVGSGDGRNSPSRINDGNSNTSTNRKRSKKKSPQTAAVVNGERSGEISDSNDSNSDNYAQNNLQYVHVTRQRNDSNNSDDGGFSHIENQIKPEINYDENETDDGPPLLEMQLSIGDEPYIVNNDNDDKNDEEECGIVYQPAPELNPHYSGDQNIPLEPSSSSAMQSVHTSVHFTRASRNSMASNINHSQSLLINNPNGTPRGVIKNPTKVAPRKVKPSPLGKRYGKRKMAQLRSKSNSGSNRSGPIKADPDNLQILQCPQCPRVFSQVSSLNLHLKRLHADEEKEHCCTMCGRKYSWRSGLYKHMRTHRNHSQQ